MNILNFKTNTNKVLDVLHQYCYPQKIIDLTRNCFSQLESALNIHDDKEFSIDSAIAWCESVFETYRPKYILAINQLNDVYQYGRITGAHLKIYQELSSYWSGICDQYKQELLSEYAEYTVFRKMLDCNHFVCFLQYNGVQTTADINYTVLNEYHQFMEESSGGPNREANSKMFLDYLAEKNLCTPSCSLYLRNVLERGFVKLSDMTEQARHIIEERRIESQSFPPSEFYDLIPDFIGRLDGARYRSTMKRDACFFLKQFHLFIDYENLGYDPIIAETWINEAVLLQCKHTGVVRGRHFFEMFENYVNEGDLLLGHQHRHQLTGYNKLPQWFQAQSDAFIGSKRKEGRKERTLQSYEGPIVRFYNCLESLGINSFDSITPETIKHFFNTDIHETNIGKRGYTSTIRQFLVFLEIHHVVREGLHFALPTQNCKGEHIVQVYSEEELEQFHQFSENAKTPRDQRDAVILMLEEDTGMRPIDIAQLQIEDIDFENLSIRFIQEKTNAPHMVPITVPTANALYFYLRDVRSRGMKYHNVFLSVKAPHHPLSRSLGRNTTTHVGDIKGGFAKYRRTYATGLIDSGETIETAARRLGHKDTHTVHKYVVLDEDRMRFTPLSLAETGLAIDGRYQINA